MKLQCARMILILLVVAAGWFAYQQPDWWPGAKPPKSGREKQTEEQKMKSTAAAQGKAPAAGVGDPGHPLSGAEKEQVEAAMESFRGTLNSIERENAKVVREIAGENNTRTISLRVRAPSQEQLGKASWSLSAQLADFAAGSPAWKEARRRGEEMLKDFNRFESGLEVITPPGAEDKTIVLLETGAKDGETKEGEGGSVSVTSDRLGSWKWEDAHKRFGHLLDETGKPTVGR